MMIRRCIIAGFCLIAATSACGSSSSPAGSVAAPADPAAPGLVQPSILDYETITRNILPNMTNASPSLAAPQKSISIPDYASLEYWTGAVTFPYMARNALSTDPSTGVESVFNLMSQIQDTVQSIKDRNGFDTNAGTCQLPDLSGIAGTATALTGADSLAVPFFGSEGIANYECLITITEYPASEGTGIQRMSYAFGRGESSSGETIISRLAFTLVMWQETTSSTAYEVFIFTTDPETSDTTVDYAIFDDKTDKMAMRARYEGDPDAHNFSFTSTLRGDLDTCTPQADSAEDEAKKLVSRGLSAGTSAAFAMRLQRACDQEALGWSGDPQLFCIDPATQAPASDETLCLLYSTDAANMSLFAASDVPFSAADFGNSNLITTAASAWQQIGGGYASSHFSSDSAFHVNASTEFAIPEMVYFDTTAYYLGYVSTGGEAFVRQAVPPDYLWQDLTPAGGFGDLASSVDITATPDTLEIVDYQHTRRNSDIWFAYTYDSPAPAGLRVWRYPGMTWTQDRYTYGEWSRVTSDSTGLDPGSGASVTNVQITSDPYAVYVSSALATGGDIQVRYIPVNGEGDWTNTCAGEVGSASLGIYAMDAFSVFVAVAYYDGTNIQVKKCEMGEGRSNTWEDYIAAGGFAPGGQVSSIGISILAGSSHPYVAYTMSSDGGELDVVTIEDGKWVYVGNRDITGAGAQGVHVAAQWPVPYLAFEDASNADALTVRQYRGARWQSAGTAIINASGNRIEDFAVIGGVPYLLYNDPQASRLLLVKFEQ